MQELRSGEGLAPPNIIKIKSEKKFIAPKNHLKLRKTTLGWSFYVGWEDIGLPFGLPRWKWRFVSKTVFPDYILCKNFSLVPKLLNKKEL
ncbi:hypothetical protein COJ48_30080 [Bacillus cereus]|nr:hypothetical protein COJ48_30080 [Bacillus cereus]PGP76319.1 hypothetical protein CN997_24885 [Bacillus cereus]